MSNVYTPELAELVTQAKQARDYIAALLEAGDGDGEALDEAAMLLEALDEALEPFEGA